MVMFSPYNVGSPNSYAMIRASSLPDRCGATVGSCAFTADNCIRFCTLRARSAKCLAPTGTILPLAVMSSLVISKNCRTPESSSDTLTMSARPSLVTARTNVK